MTSRATGAIQLEGWAQILDEKDPAENLMLTFDIEFKNTRLALIHIPIELYPYFVQPIIRLLFHNAESGELGKGLWTAGHVFLNVSITPVECSIVCSRELFNRFLGGLVDRFHDATDGSGKRLVISMDDYIVIGVDGQGLDAGQRVLELTGPLAMAGIPIFFITTYFSDYILVPHRTRSQVTHALEQRGFAFEQSADAFVNQSPLAKSHSTFQNHTRNKSSTSSSSSPPSTPPATSIQELQTRTFSRLKRNNISPSVDTTLALISCAAQRDPAVMTRLAILTFQSALMHILVSPNTRFLSLTLTDSDPASLLLEQSSTGAFGDVLLGSKDDILVPITLDLRELPLEATGIVCGVAGRLATGTSRGEEGAVEIRFLSTAKAGTVIVAQEDLERAKKALDEGACLAD